ncbi:MAG: dihydroorotate dehydrogenase [Clostridia bacterium]|nr:dihydroorotate dehydrogenase [Clostridia bacterium]MCI8980549.1 dihydroorotate dehydrogenase [Clostridia bacterium]MCI9086237.1 dihydroorotate dehydrogenase [Clostridia bacterium]
MINTKINFCGVDFKNPIVTASGTFGFGMEYNQIVPIEEYGGFGAKGLTRYPREGNKPPRIAETPSGILNSVGLQNPGVEYFAENIMPVLSDYDTNVIANMSGNTVEEYCEMAQILSDTDVSLIEMNISCPNVKHGGLAFGTDPKVVNELTKEVKKYCKKPLVVKLSPNVTSIAEIAKAAEDGGADALSLINTLLGMKIDINTRRPVLKNNTGGLSGPAVKPVAVRMICEVHNAVNLPIIGMGGVMNGADVIEMMLAGASLVALGTGLFAKPDLIIQVKQEIEEYMQKNNIDNINTLIGAAVMN